MIVVTGPDTSRYAPHLRVHLLDASKRRSVSRRRRGRGSTLGDLTPNRIRKGVGRLKRASRGSPWAILITYHYMTKKHIKNHEIATPQRPPTDHVPHDRARDNVQKHTPRTTSGTHQRHGQRQKPFPCIAEYTAHTGHTQNEGLRPQYKPLRPQKRSKMTRKKAIAK